MYLYKLAKHSNNLVFKIYYKLYNKIFKKVIKAANQKANYKFIEVQSVKKREHGKFKKINYGQGKNNNNIGEIYLKTNLINDPTKIASSVNDYFINITKELNPKSSSESALELFSI